MRDFIREKRFFAAFRNFPLTKHRKSVIIMIISNPRAFAARKNKSKTVTKTVGSSGGFQRAAEGAIAAVVGFYRISLCSRRPKGLTY